MYQYNSILAALLLCSVFSIQTWGQNNSSPYSILGLGDLESSYFNRTSGMANTGIAFRSDQTLINNNPAAYTALIKQIFITEVSARGRFINYSGRNITTGNNVSRDFAVRRFSTGTKLTNWWGSGIGLAPFSTSNYSFSGRKNLQGSNSYLPADYEGTGGVSQVYWTNGFEPVKNFSIGINASLLWGNLSQEETLYDNDGSAILTSTRAIYLSHPYLNYGLQYKATLSKSWKAVVGATFANRQKLQSTYDLTVRNGEDTALLKSEVLKRSSYSLPQNYGVGIAFTKNNRYSFLADYKLQSWSSLNYKGRNYSLQDSRRFSGGFQYSKKEKVWNREVEKLYLQCGGFYSQSYLKIYGEQLQDYGVSAGFGQTLKNSPLCYGVALEYGTRGINSQRLIKEQYFNVTIHFTYRDLWYTQGRKYN